MRLKFTKMQGLGNDFVVIDAVRQCISLSPVQIRFLADRHFGIGCDQLLLVESAGQGSDADFRYRIFNADGGEVAQCGNGARCFARFVREQGLCGRDVIQVDTDAGRLVLELGEAGQVTVDMGNPRHAPTQIPMQAEVESTDYVVRIDDQDWRFGAVSMGNPHAILRVEDVDGAPVETLGPKLESHAIFPERANIGFMQVVNSHAVRLRVFERGSGETLACGSGACAAVVSGIERGWLESPVNVSLPGGDLSIAWQGRGSSVLMTGPAVTVFEGEIEL